MIPILHRTPARMPLITFRVVVVLAFQLAVSSCSNTADSTRERSSDRPTAIQDEKGDPALTIVIDQDAGWIVRLFDSDDRVKFQLGKTSAPKSDPTLPPSSTDIVPLSEILLTFESDDGTRLNHARAALVIPDPSSANAYRLYVVLESQENPVAARVVTEHLVSTAQTLSPENWIRTGRLFVLPLRGRVEEFVVRPHPNEPKIFVNAQGVERLSGEPVVAVYDISTDSDILEPVDLLMPPNR